SQGVELTLGGTVSNTSTGLIEGVYAVKITGGAALVSNAATIVGTGGLATGVYLSAAGRIINSGSIGGMSGIVLRNGGANTIGNFGVISGGPGGTAGRAINLGAGTNEVIIEQGSALVGVVGNFRIGDTFDLPFMSFSASGTVTLGAGNVLKIFENGQNF